MYKLRIYKKNGTLDHEETFPQKEDMDKRYRELFVYKNYSLNPTAWELLGNKWYRIMGY